MPISISGDGSIGSLSATEIGYLDGVTSAVQTQINGKLTTPGVWTSYTPTWGGASSNPAIGNGTLVGRYVQIGTLVIFRIFLQAGSSTTFGSGYWHFNYPPINRSTNESVLPGINGIMYDASLNTYSTIFGIFEHSSTQFALGSAGSAGAANAIGSISPMTWATSDLVRIYGIYEAA